MTNEDLIRDCLEILDRMPRRGLVHLKCWVDPGNSTLMWSASKGGTIVAVSCDGLEELYNIMSDAVLTSDKETKYASV